MTPRGCKGSVIASVPRMCRRSSTVGRPVIPTPLTDADRAGGSCPCAKSRCPGSCGFFESLVTDNIGVGRPHEMAMALPARCTARPGTLRTRVFAPGAEVKIHSQQAQPHQPIPQRRQSAAHRDRDQQTIRHRRASPPPPSARAHRAARARQPSCAYPGTSRQGCAIGSVFFRAHPPPSSKRPTTGALRFRDERAMTLTGALCLLVHTVAGLTKQEPSRAGRRIARP